MKSNHGAVLEHGTVYMTFKWWQIGKKLKYLFNPYSKIRKFKYVTTNLRVLFEHDWMKDLNYFCEPTEFHERRVTAKFICSRGVSHEAVRHRVMSMLQESQRYCMYSKEKMGGEITIIIPEWIKAKINDIASYNGNDDLAQIPYSKALIDERVEKDMSIVTWKSAQGISENYYMRLIELGCKAEEARGVLTNDCKTELIMTGFVSDWNHFFDLRSKGTTGKPHPDIKILADDLLFQFIDKGYIK
jgi:thymidylate synthase (FAD)